MKEIFLCFIFLLISFFKASATDQPVIKLPEYDVYGFQHFSNGNVKANIYLGLPYAKAPVGELRFEKPEPLPHIPGKSVNATVFSPACHQLEDMAHMGIESSEDCLYLNIMTPSEAHNELYPVLVFIHGGGYAYGFTKVYGYETYVNNIVSQKIIMVTLQYRLAHFGFLATEDFEVGGNFAHFDQIMAMKFIQQNIEAFGGDPARVTLSGHSAGSLSVHTLSLSPQAKNLFSQEIHMAASNNAEWPIANNKVFSHSELISKAVGCGQKDTKERKACLKTVRYDEFWKVRNDLNLLRFGDDYQLLYWTTVYDNDLFEGKRIGDLVPKMPVKNILYGIDAGEGLLFSLITGNPITSVFALTRGFSPENRGSATKTTIETYLHSMLTYENFTPEIKNSIIDEIFEFYQIGDNFKETNPLHYFEKYTDMLTDTLMVIPAVKEADGKLKHGFNNQYMYVFNYTRPQDRHFMGNLPAHGYEHVYFSGINAYAINYDGIFSEEEKLLEKHFAELFVTFVKTGKPSAGEVSVPPITDKEFPYVEFNPDVNIKTGYFEPRAQFWENLMKKYGHDFILGKDFAKKSAKSEL